MRDRVIAVLDVASWVGALVWAFTGLTIVVIGTGALCVLAVALGWRDRKDARPRSSWRYWSEPRIDMAERWSPIYWGVLTAAHGVLVVGGFLLSLQGDEMTAFVVPATFASLAGWGWWNVAQARPTATTSGTRGHA